MRNLLYVCIIGLLFIGCKDDDLSSAISSPTTTAQEDKSQDFDKKTYAGLEDVFQDTSIIQPHDKYMMIVFGANGCKYCEMLKEDIKQDSALKEDLKDNFSAYYVNLSYSKNHKFTINNNGEKKEYSMLTRDLARIYNIGPTPTIVFSTPNGETIVSYPGYLPSKQFRAMLSFITSGEWKKANGDTLKLQQSLQSYIINQIS